MNIITSAFLAARPKTLTASLIPVWAGCMVVQKLTGSSGCVPGPPDTDFLPVPPDCLQFFQ